MHLSLIVKCVEVYDGELARGACSGNVPVPDTSRRARRVSSLPVAATRAAQSARCMAKRKSGIREARRDTSRLTSAARLKRPCLVMSKSSRIIIRRVILSYSYSTSDACAMLMNSCDRIVESERRHLRHKRRGASRKAARRRRRAGEINSLLAVHFALRRRLRRLDADVPPVY